MIWNKHPTVQPWLPVDIYEHFCAHKEMCNERSLFTLFEDDYIILFGGSEVFRIEAEQVERDYMKNKI